MTSYCFSFKFLGILVFKDVIISKVSKFFTLVKIFKKVLIFVDILFLEIFVLDLEKHPFYITTSKSLPDGFKKIF